MMNYWDNLTEADVSDLKLVVVDGLLEAAVEQLHSTTQWTLHTQENQPFIVNLNITLQIDQSVIL